MQLFKECFAKKEKFTPYYDEDGAVEQEKIQQIGTAFGIDSRSIVSVEVANAGQVMTLLMTNTSNATLMRNNIQAQLQKDNRFVCLIDDNLDPCDEDAGSTRVEISGEAVDDFIKYVDENQQCCRPKFCTLV